MVLRQTLDSACRVRSVFVKLFSCCHMGGRAVGESRAECCHMGVAVSSEQGYGTNAWSASERFFRLPAHHKSGRTPSSTAATALFVYSGVAVLLLEDRPLACASKIGSQPLLSSQASASAHMVQQCTSYRNVPRSASSTQDHRLAVAPGQQRGAVRWCAWRCNNLIWCVMHQPTLRNCRMSRMTSSDSTSKLIVDR